MRHPDEEPTTYRSGFVVIYITCSGPGQARDERQQNISKNTASKHILNTANLVASCGHILPIYGLVKNL